MTSSSQRYIRELALTTARTAFWRPSYPFQMFLAASVPSQVATVLRTPYRSDEVVKVLMEGFWWRNYCDQHTPEEIEFRLKQIEDELARRALQTGAGKADGGRSGERENMVTQRTENA